MSSNVSSTPDWHWLRDLLIALLASPHSFSGVDPFSVQYDKIFTDDVEGVIAAKHMKKHGLKEALLTVQKGWDPESVIFEAEYAPQPRQVGTRCRWKHKIAGKEVQLSILASVETVQDAPPIRAITLYTYGDPTIFGRLGTFRHA